MHPIKTAPNLYLRVRAAKKKSDDEPDALNLHLHLHLQQWLAFETSATEVLYGGAAGGGKSHLMRVVAIVLSAAIPGPQTYLFRRIVGDLIKNHVEGPKGFRTLLAPWVWYLPKKGRTRAAWCVPASRVD
jgi:hypothetical protein